MPDLYLDELWLELQETAGVDVSISTIWRTLVKGGYSMKKVKIHISLNRKLRTHSLESLIVLPLSAVLRNGQTLLPKLAPMNLINFVDESAVDRRTTYRGRAWAIRGHKATRKCFFCRGKR